MTKRRARNLTDGTVAQIIGILDGWTGALSWDKFIEAIYLRLHERYTRQALYAHRRIADAFSLRKRSIASEDGTPITAKSPQLQAALQKIARLEAENNRLSKENAFLNERFVRWIVNANTRGLDEQYLDQPLAPIDREQTKSTVVVQGKGRNNVPTLRAKRSGKRSSTR